MRQAPMGPSFKLRHGCDCPLPLPGVTVRGLGEGSTSVKSTVRSAKVHPLFLVSGDCWGHRKKRGACSA